MSNSSLERLKARLAELIKFSLVGVLNTLVDFLVFTILNGPVGLRPTPSHIISYSCGVANSYSLNRRWTFRVKGSFSMPELLKFIGVNLLSLAVSTLVISYLVEGGPGINKYIGKLIATVCALGVNFIGSRLFVFKSSENDK